MDNSDQKNYELVPSSKKDLINISPLIRRGLDLAKDITDLSKYRGSLLWVDDNLDAAGFAKNFFSKRGYKVVTFENGLAALEHLKKNHYDLLITQLPISERLLRAELSLIEDQHITNLPLLECLKKAKLSRSYLING